MAGAVPALARDRAAPVTAIVDVLIVVAGMAGAYTADIVAVRTADIPIVAVVTDASRIVPAGSATSVLSNR